MYEEATKISEKPVLNEEQLDLLKQGPGMQYLCWVGRKDGNIYMKRNARFDPAKLEARKKALEFAKKKQVQYWAEQGREYGIPAPQMGDNLVEYRQKLAAARAKENEEEKKRVLEERQKKREKRIKEKIAELELQLNK